MIDLTTAALTIGNLLLLYATYLALRMVEAEKAKYRAPALTDEQKWRATMAEIVSEGMIFADMAERFEIIKPVAHIAGHGGLLWNVDWDVSLLSQHGIVARVQGLPNGRGLIDFVKVR